MKNLDELSVAARLMDAAVKAARESGLPMTAHWVRCPCCDGSGRRLIRTCRVCAGSGGIETVGPA